MQGVGFRPFIFNLADEFSLTGTVANTLEGVHIYVNCDQERLDHFVQLIHEKSPTQALITSINYEETDNKAFKDFSIIESSLDGNPDLLITPDFAICYRCKQELGDPLNKRYRYPYITCTYCGPRYSIESDLPYDRHRTSMGSFKMCNACEEEYMNPTDRRFYSQTNSCPECRISQWVVNHDGMQEELDEDKIIDFVCDKIKGGSVVAVKGIGGFLLMCDPYNEITVNKLRKIKQRPSKPFALLYPNEDQVMKNFQISQDELNELQSPAAPIVLIKLRNSSSKAIELLPTIAPGLDRLGVMIPYAPLLVLIAEKISQPLLATSGNRKASPIVYKNEEAIESLSGFADFFLLNNREIKIPQDDSVIKFSERYHQKIVIRRSRGYAPAFVQNAIDVSFSEQVLAMGALLKSTFCIWQKGRTHISQFLGDTTEFDAQISYERTLQHVSRLLKFKPEVVLVDKHPAYFTAQIGKEISIKNNASFIQVLHHEAHFWAVLGENNLLKADQDVLGVVFDGTGMGNDGAIWGGEFYRYSQHKLSRIKHINYYPHILGDKMAREPRLSAFALLHAVGENIDLIKEYFTGEEIDYYSRVLDHSTLMTSSMGRLFDAMSSLLGLCQINTYEGEAAMYLECEAQNYCNREGQFSQTYTCSFTNETSIDFRDLISAIIRDIKTGKNPGEIAARFHRTIVQMIEEVVLRGGFKSIAFSGGVFQNGLLVDMIIDQLGDKFKLYFHKHLSPNDECISYGQLVGYYTSKILRKKKKEVSYKKSAV